MIRLHLHREPHRLDLGHGVNVTVLPSTTALMMAARRQAAAETCTTDDERITALVKAIGRLVITEWEGVGDDAGTVIAPTSEGIDALLDLWPFAEAFQHLYLGPALLLDAEKNASAPLPTGTSVGAPGTAQAASEPVPSALTA